MKAFLIASLLLAGGCVSALKSTNANPVVSTSYGMVQGIQEMNGQVNAFKGIPYASPPVGALRFADPQDVNAWMGTLDASQFSAGCMAECPKDVFPLPELMCPKSISEDCLYLNIFTPNISANANLPVMVFFHGGNYIRGAGGVDFYDGSPMASSQNVVVVTINYRLGLFGGLHTDMIGGNFQISDQRQALMFVSQVISNFGGNAMDVTITGQSAGAFSVTSHLVSPASWPYFQKAIYMSAPAALLAPNLTMAESLGDQVIAAVNCTKGGQQEVDCLRAVPAETLLAIQPSIKYRDLSQFLAVMEIWNPVAYGPGLPNGGPIEAIGAGQFSPVPIMFGTVANESVPFINAITTKPIGELELIAFIDIAFGFEVGTQALEKYGPVPASQKNDTHDFMAVIATDYIFYCPARYMGTAYAKQTPTFIWYFDIAASFQQWGYNGTNPYCVHTVCHAADLPFVFDPFKVMPPNVNAPSPLPAEQELINFVQTQWGNFMKTGNPNTPNPLPWNIQFPMFNPAQNILVNQSTPASLLPNYRASYCDFWDSVGYNRY